MAKPLPFSPHTQTFHSLGTELISNSIPSSIWTRILSSLNYSPKNTTTTTCANINVRRFSSVYTISLPPISSTDHSLLSGRLCLSFSNFPLFPLRRSRSPPLWPSHLKTIMSHSVHSQAADANADATNNPPQETTKTVRCVIKGRVQGVFYRNWTVENATQMGLKGWVRNRRDGAVEALFSGKADVVDEMLTRCRRGPADAMVTAFEATPSNDDPGASFERKPTV